MKRLGIVLLNIVIVAALVTGVMVYSRTTTEAAVVQNREKFADNTAIMEEIASNYLSDSQAVADRWAALINGSDFTMESAIAMLQEMTLVEGASGQIVWMDGMTGLATEGKASNPDDFTVNYSGNLSGVLSGVTNLGGTKGQLHVTHRYSNPQTGAYVVAFCSGIQLTDETGSRRDAILLYVLPVSTLESRWTFPTEYGDASEVALIDSDGEYVIKPSGMKGEAFFSYIYSYNQGTISDAALQAEMNANDSGTFEAKNAAGETCYYAYVHLANNEEWMLVAAIPSAVLGNTQYDWTNVLIIIIGLVVLLVIDLAYLGTERRQDRETHDAIKAQWDVIGALAEDYSNVFNVAPGRDTADIIKLEGYVTDELTRETKIFPLEHIVGNYARDRVHAEEREEFKRMLSAENFKAVFADRKEFDYTYRIDADGGIHHFNAHMVRISKPGEELHVVVGFRNIDAIVAEQEKSRKTLEEALNAAQHANRAKTTFLNSMSHDIRTPMNAIIGFTTLAATHVEDTALVKDYLKKIQVSSNHLLSLINDVLDMSRIESGKVKIEVKEVHLPDVLHDLRTIVQSDIKANQLELLIDTMDVETEDIFCDKLRLNQVLLNIVSNAIKFTGPGGQVAIRIVEHQDAPEGYARYSFHIKDTGIGMSEEFQQHIFEPFTREQAATVSGIQGSGLGMAITKNIVDMMGGTISVKSKVGVGSEFTVDLTFRRSGNKVVYGPIPELEGTAVLVVDDDTDCCLSVSRMLQEIGMRPEWTSSGREAVVRTQFACDRGDPFGAYIIDWLMPDMNGVETVRRIRHVIGEQKPIIVLTAYDWGDIEQEAREAGVTQFVSKPIFMSELREALQAPFRTVEPVAEPEEETFDFTGCKVLLVEDNVLNREIATEILEEAGFAVDTAEDGSVAVEQLRDMEPGRYDVVLMDIQMPIMDGYEATRQIRALANKAAAELPIIAMTANAFEEDKQLAFAAGMNGHVAKPIDIPTLMETLKGILGK